MDLVCEADGCRKVFSRKDHLKRHQANHAEAAFHCSGTDCGKSFRRLDLLQRHERRGVCDANPDLAQAAMTSQHLNEKSTISSGAGQTERAQRKREAEDMVDPRDQSIGQHQLLQSLPPPDVLPSMAYSEQPTYSNGSEYTVPQPMQQSSDSPFWNILNSFENQPQPDIELWDQFRSQNLSQSEPENWDWYPFQGTDLFETWGANGASPEVPAIWTAPPPSSTWAESSSDAIRRQLVEQESILRLQELVGDQPPQLPTAKRAKLSSAREEGRLRDTVSRWQHPDLPDVDDATLKRLIATYPTELDPTEYTLDLLRASLSTYWRTIATGLPFIHQGTFSYATAPTSLVLLMSIVGCSHLSAPTFPALDSLRTRFREVVRRIRGELVADLALAMPISSVQTFCLCHIHDMWMSTADAQLVAQCTWSVMVVHSRRKGIGTGTRVDDTDESTAVSAEEKEWRKWAKDEERRRSAFYICQMDTQISGFFNQHPSRSLSIFAHRINLPCGADEWDAHSPAEWRAARRMHTEDETYYCPHGGKPSHDSSSPRHLKLHHAKPASAPFLPGIHPEFKVQRAGEGWSTCIQAALSLSSDEPLPFPAGCPTYAYNAELILTGLLAVAWDCRVRGGIGIRIWDGSNNLKNWKSNVLRSMLKLRYTVEHGHGASDTPSRINLRDSFALAIISVLSDIPMLQIVAGATNICGSIIGRREYTDAKRRHKLWAKSSDARTCVSLCAKHLQEVLNAPLGLYSTWAIYLCTLVVWSYGNAVHGTTERSKEPPSVDLYLETIVSAPSVDTLADLQGLNQSQALLLAAARRIGTRTPVDEEHSALLVRWVVGDFARV